MSTEASTKNGPSPHRAYGDDLPPPDVYDPVIEAYKRDVDRTLLRESLKLTVDQRVQLFESFMKFAAELRAAGQRSRGAQ